MITIYVPSAAYMSSVICIYMYICTHVSNFITTMPRVHSITLEQEIYYQEACHIKCMVAKKGQKDKGKIQQLNLTSKRNKNVLIIMLVGRKMCVKLRSKMFGNCTGRSELILGILTCVEC